ncbi:MAG: hypothetical protein AAFV19_23760 [Pseudomonadota bacterium]
MSDCIYCGHRLPKNDAWLCKECGHWQFRGSFLLPQIGNLALYGSLVVLLFTNFSGAIFGRAADLKISPLACGQYQARVYLSNKGNYEAVFATATLRAYMNQYSTTEKAATTTVDWGDAKNSGVIATDKGWPVTVGLHSSSRPGFLDGVDVSKDACRVEVKVTALIDATGKKDVEPREVCTCADFTASE